MGLMRTNVFRHLFVGVCFRLCVRCRLKSWCVTLLSGKAADLRPAGLYVELLHAIVRLSRSQAWWEHS